MSPQPDHAFRLALQHHQAGRLAEAEETYRQALAGNPRHAGALHGLGTLALAADQAELAEQLIRAAITLRGEWPEACYHLGLALHRRERFDEAIAAFRRAATLNPALFDAHYQLAVCLQLTGQRDKAIAAYRQAIALRGNDPYSLTNFAVALRSAGQLQEAIAVLRQAVALQPDLAAAFDQLGMALRDVGALDDAIEAFARATRPTPQGFAAWTHLAEALRDAGRIPEAIAAQRQAVAIRPDDPDANWALGNLLLLNGDIAEGGSLLEWRWKRKALPWPRRRFSQPMWDGEDLAGRTIYLHAEQSFSDAIHFARYIPQVAQRGGRIIVECQPALRRLFAESFGTTVAQWFSPGEPAPAFDVYCPLLSLPPFFGVAPADVPYLRVAPETARTWEGKIIDEPDVLRVGLAWAGSPSELQDRKRSMSLADFAPLGGIKGVRFFSLQTGRAAAEARLSPPAVPLIDLTGALADFADTAAMASRLDLIISVDTAIAHLAGAMGKTVWTLLPLVPHWRWGMRGESATWYPTMRLFRQAARGEWSEVIETVRAALFSLSLPGRGLG